MSEGTYAVYPELKILQDIISKIYQVKVSNDIYCNLLFSNNSIKIQLDPKKLATGLNANIGNCNLFIAGHLKSKQIQISLDKSEPLSWSEPLDLSNPEEVEKAFRIIKLAGFW